MAKAPPKTNAARALERAGVSYELRTYEVGDGHLSAGEVAAQAGMDPATVFKTLLAHGDQGGHCMAVIPATAELDLKALARASGDRKVTMVPLKEVQPLTGYVRGGVTALAAKRAFPVYLDESALAHPRIAVSAGRRGLQLVLDPGDYVRATGATTAALSAG
ncbi:MAG: Cys-tRNA(Pro) deacylase [Myxococcales bacterium]|jgi:Cys-tRNA(Pro)/Cys-tRNA(Cys) deacylase